LVWAAAAAAPLSLAPVTLPGGKPKIFVPGDTAMFPSIIVWPVLVMDELARTAKEPALVVTTGGAAPMLGEQSTAAMIPIKTKAARDLRTID
jgi:hypothetical protein